MLRLRSPFLSLAVSLGSLVLGPGARPAFAQGAISGTVVDPSGAAVVRAIVRVVDAAGKEAAVTLTDARGRFTFATVSCNNCNVEASGTGFTPASAAIGSGEIKISLGLAPLRDEVVVTATLEPTPVSQTGASVTVITAADIERRGTPLVADLMRTTPSATVVRTGMPGGVTSLFIRAGESDYVKVLLDGMPLNEPGGTFFFDRLSSDRLEQIEIVRGAHSALFGSDAMSGVVQLVSKRGVAGRPSVSAEVSGGSYSTARFGGSVAGRRNAWDYLAGVTRFSTDNRVPNSEFDETSASWSAGGAIRSNLLLRTTGRFDGGESGAPGRTAFGERDGDAHAERRDVIGGVRLDHNLGSFSQRLLFSSSRSDQRSENRIDGGGFVATFEGQTGRRSFEFLNASHNRLTRQRLSYQGDWNLGQMAAMPGRHSLTVAADVEAERGDLESLDPATLARTQLIEASRNNAGAAIQYQWAAGRGAVTAGIRFDRNEHFGGAASPRVLGSYVASTGRGVVGETRLRFSAGKGIKAPTIIETYSPNLFFQGNPDLKPERSWSIDAGVEQRLLQDRLRVDAVYFETRNRDQISTATTDLVNFFSKFFNVGSTRARGLELSVDAAPAARLRARGGYSLVASEILEAVVPDGTIPPAAFVAGRWALRRPRHAGFAEAIVTEGRLSVSVTGTFVGRRTDSDQGSFTPALTELPAYALWRTGVRYSLPRNVEVTFDIDNLTNTDYMEPMGYLTLDRTFRIGARVRF